MNVRSYVCACVEKRCDCMVEDFVALLLGVRFSLSPDILSKESFAIDSNETRNG